MLSSRLQRMSTGGTTLLVWCDVPKPLALWGEAGLEPRTIGPHSTSIARQLYAGKPVTEHAAGVVRLARFPLDHGISSWSVLTQLVKRGLSVQTQQSHAHALLCHVG